LIQKNIFYICREEKIQCDETNTKPKESGTKTYPRRGGCQYQVESDPIDYFDPEKSFAV
jgi:hypothetical protein